MRNDNPLAARLSDTTPIPVELHGKSTFVPKAVPKEQEISNPFMFA
eukprot:CAMPEP_0194425976 /NCGR_PEP_ID=MMETSP0176-20130528/26879_1 /TAXON_ID=216777 /ORGANISM="Proboscia alata, Strain PI-D3" /LENGTH=45 /DNA_ID= /DNA_START= /DNA_END= /DNA_ORIENTATION=